LLVSVPQPVTYGSDDTLLATLDEELLAFELLELLATLELLELATLELLDLELLELATLELLELDATELLEDDDVAGPTEHHAEVVKVLLGKAEPMQAKLSVFVAYTKLPDWPRATECVPLIVQVAPVFCAHLV
jgi:hypothetical protein